MLAEGFMYRHNLQTRRLDGLVTEGAIGRLQLVRAPHLPPRARARRPPGSRARGRLGARLGAYCAAAPASRRRARDRRRPAGARAHRRRRALHGQPRLPGRVLGLFDCGLRTPFRAELEAGRLRRFTRCGRPLALQQPGHEPYRRRHRANPSPDAGLVPARAGGFRPRRGGEAQRSWAGRTQGQARALAALRRSAAECVSGQGLSFEVSATRKFGPSRGGACGAGRSTSAGLGRRDVPARAVVGDDHPVALERTKDDPALGEAPDLEVGAQPQLCAPWAEGFCRCSSRHGGPGRRSAPRALHRERRAWSISPLATSS